MGIYITGDTHGDIAELDSRTAGLGLAENDILIVTGDFGFDWNPEVIERWKEHGRPYTVLFCDGNHENFDILESLPEEKRFGSTVGKLGGKTFRLLSGHMYDIGGLKTFVFGGASSIDRKYRVPGRSWWPQEIPPHKVFETARKTLRKNSWKFDIFLSHTCDPETKKHVLDAGAFDFCDPVEEMIDMLDKEISENRGSYRMHFFGHFHTDRDRGKRHCLYQRVVPIGNPG